MKTIDEIHRMLVSDIKSSANRLKKLSIKLVYYNELLEGTSYILASLLDSSLKNQFDDWNPDTWIDDSLITKVNLVDSSISIWGIMIWGVEEQWTEPFYFKMEMTPDYSDIIRYSILFADLDRPALSYEDFRHNRGYWDENYYRNENWDPSRRNWKYIINFRCENLS